MKILVTGHMGFIGSYLLSRLVSEAHRVYGMDKKEGTDIRTAKYFPKVDLVYHLAAQTSVMDSLDNPLEDATDNILATIRLYCHYKDTKIIYTASGGASEQEEIVSPYGLSKKVAGDYLKSFHKNTVICNLPNVFGEGGKGVIELFLAHDELVIYGDGHQTRDFVYVDDIVDGLVKAAKWYPEVYFLGSGKEVTVLELAKVTRKPYRFEKPRGGELEKSVLPNITPNWKPKVDVIEYLKKKLEATK